MKPYNLIVTSIVDPKFATLPKVDVVKRILDHWGYHHIQYIDYLWYGWSSKLLYILRACKELPESTHIMFIDAADVILLASPDEVMERYFALGHPWVYNAEVNIWSPGSFQPDDYPPCDTPFRYLNAGASIANREHMIHWFDKWTEGGKTAPQQGIRISPSGDQDWMAGHFLKGYPDAIKLDTGCELFQTGCGSRMGDDPIIQVSPGKVYNRITDTYPLIIHANGGDDICRPEWRKLWQSMLD